MNTRIRKIKSILYYWWIIALLIVILLLAGEGQTAGALGVVTVCLLPPLRVSLRTSYLSVKIFCATVLVTQVITVPMFYLLPDRYYFADHRPFSFTASEALPVFLILGLFLWLLVYFVRFSEKCFGAPVKFLKTNRGLGNVGPSNMNKVAVSGARRIGISKRNLRYMITIVLLVVVMIPFNFWMFDMGIGLTGAAPPRLPYRLSGIFAYLQNYIFPGFLGYLYIKTKRRSFLLAVFLSVYALLLGICAVSKGVVLFVTAPIVAFAWLDKRWGILTFTILAAGFGVMMASSSRAIVHISDGFTTGSFTELGTLGTLEETFLRMEWSPERFLIFENIVGRIESFLGLFLASQFNPEAVGGAGAILIKVISNSWVDLGHDALHLEYLGYTIPLGFHNVAASFNAWMLMAVNNNILMVLPFAAYAAATLVILEKTLMRAAYKHRLPLNLAQSFLFFVTLWFYTGTGSEVFKALFSASVVLWFIAALRSVRLVEQNYKEPPNRSER
jgi:hypothetical protein